MTSVTDKRKAWLTIFLTAFIALLAGAGNSLTTKVLLSLPCDAVCYSTSNTTGLSSTPRQQQQRSSSTSTFNDYFSARTTSTNEGITVNTVQDDDNNGPPSNDDDGPTNYSNGTKPFAKPLFSVLVAFAAMALSIFWVIGQRCSCCTPRNHHQRVEESSTAPSIGNDNDITHNHYHPTDVGTRSGLASLLLSIQNDNNNQMNYHHHPSQRSTTTKTYTSLNSSTEEQPDSSSSAALASSSSRCTYCCYYAPLLIPTCLDLIATLLQAASVLFISAGVSTALRGSLLLFTGLASWCVGSKEKRASTLEWIGILISTVGAIAVGLSAFLNDNGIPRAAAIAVGFGNYSNEILITIGVVLSTLSNVVQGIQVAYETLFLEGNKYTAMETNGIEGIYGILMSILLLVVFQYLPYNTIPFDNGYAENSHETLCCLQNSPSIVYGTIALGGLFAVSTIAYMNLSSLRGGNFRALLMVARGGIVWATEIIYYYAIENPSSKNHQENTIIANGGRWGEPWGTYSWVAIVGFIVMTMGGYLTWKAQTIRELENNYEKGLTTLDDDDDADDDEQNYGYFSYPSSDRKNNKVVLSTTTTATIRVVASPSNNDRSPSTTSYRTNGTGSNKQGRKLPYGQKGIYADLLAGLVEEEEINYL